MRSTAPDRVVIVVPAHDEERLIGGALRALRVAAAAVRSRADVSVVVVANGCSDGTAAVARAAGASVLETPVANVGAARAAGCAWALEQTSSPDRLWLATTDADSRVGPRWLSAQLDAAAGGADAYLGTVTLSETDRRMFAAWVAGYETALETAPRHGHVHGASMGMRADTYVLSGGFGGLEVGEDADLATRLADTGARITWDASCPVMTSARLAARAPAGVARDLELSLMECDEAV